MLNSSVSKYILRQVIYSESAKNQSGLVHIILLVLLFCLLLALVIFTYYFSTGKFDYLLQAPRQNYSFAPTITPTLSPFIQATPIVTLTPTVTKHLTPTPTMPEPTPTPVLSSYDLNIIVIKYFPPDPNNTNQLNYSLTGILTTIDALRQKIDAYDQTALENLTNATKYHGYKISNAIPFIKFHLIKDTEYLQPIPLSNNKVPWHANDPIPTYRPDYFNILSGINICNLVDQQDVRQVWIWGYHYNQTEPVESDQSMGYISKSFWNHGDYGDVSNSEETNDLPTCQHTYTLFNYDYSTGESNMLHDQGHNIESIMEFIDPTLWNNFRFPAGSDNQVNHCGQIHNPPNNSYGFGTNALCSDLNSCSYNYISQTSANSDCEDWTPDNNGRIESINCHTWYGAGPCTDDGGRQYFIWWMQNIPGLNNQISYQGRELRNWWDFIYDFDKALSDGKNL